MSTVRDHRSPMVSRRFSTKDWTRRCWQACVLQASAPGPPLRALLLGPDTSSGPPTRRNAMAKKPPKTRRTKPVAGPHETKQSAVLALLRRHQGASVDEIIAI